MSRQSYSASQYSGGRSTTSSPSAPTGGGGGRDASQSDFSPPSPPSTPSPSVGGGQDYSSVPASTPAVDPGFVRALDEQARFQTSLGDPDPEVDVPAEERDSITSFFDNYAANVASNPFELGLIGALKTSYQTNKAREAMRGTPGYAFLGSGLRDNSVARGDEGGQALTNIISQAPFAISGTTPTQSIVQDYFANLGMSDQSALSPKLESDYNAAKQRINNLLNITPVSQQFGYSTDPYGGLLASNLQTNPFNIEYLRTRGLI